MATVAPAPYSGPESDEEKARTWKEDADGDFRSREAIKERIRRDDGNYTDDEELRFKLALQMEENVLAGMRLSSKQSTLGAVARKSTIKAKKAMRMKVSNKSTKKLYLVYEKVKTKYSQLDASTVFDGENHVLYGRVECLLRAPAIDVLAFIMDNDSNINSKYERGVSTLDFKTLEVVNDHRSVFYLLVAVPPPFQNREFIASVLWRQEGVGQYLCVSYPTDHESLPLSNKIVRAETLRAVRLTEVSPGVTRYEVTYTMDMKGRSPTWITNNLVIPANLEGPAIYQKYFQLVKGVDDFDEDGEDMALLAQMMMDDVYSHTTLAHREAALREYFIRAASFRQVCAEYPWFKVLLWNMVRNRVRPASTCNTLLGSLTSAEAEGIGASLGAALLSSTTPEIAIEEWLLAYPAMRELDARFVLFRPLSNRIATVLLGSAGWGMKSRVLAGALLSVFDLGTDINMIRQFYVTGENSAANGMIAMIVLTMLVQMLNIYAQNRRKSWRVIAREMMIVLSFLKPGVDAYRILQGGENDPLLTWDPMLEATYSKSTELLFEAIPASILQATILMSSEVKTPLAIFSLATSALTIAYTVTTITFDMDTSPENRRRSPELWGFVPDQGRGRVFVLMVLLSMWQVVAKVFSIALLATTSALWLIVWLVSDLLLYFLYKAARRDFVYYIPGLSGGMKCTAAFLSRMLQKISADVTGLLLVRNSYEMGGSYFAFNMAASQASCWIAAYLYAVHYKDKHKVNNETAYVLIGALQGLWILTLLLFFSKIKRAFWKTFYSTQSGRQCTMACFLDNREDALKVVVFRSHEDLWSDIRSEVKTYMHENWARWESAKPAWFDDNFKSTIPDEFIPKADLDLLNKMHGGKRRRSSVGIVAFVGEG